MNVLLTGIAGAGKSLLTRSLGRWLELVQGFRVCYVNLDAGAESLPYSAHVDIRRSITVTRIMMDEGLGMNGAIVLAAERSIGQLGWITSEISTKAAAFTLIDSPGQQEVFAFRDFGPRTAEALRALGPTVALHVIDAPLAQTPSALVTALALAAFSHLRLAVPTLYVVNKVDLGGRGQIIEMLSDRRAMRRMLELERAGTIKDMSLGLLANVEDVMTAQRPLLVSALSGEGIPELYNAINETECACGDLT